MPEFSITFRNLRGRTFLLAPSTFPGGPATTGSVNHYYSSVIRCRPALKNGNASTGSDGRAISFSSRRRHARVHRFRYRRLDMPWRTADKQSARYTSDKTSTMEPSSSGNSMEKIIRSLDVDQPSNEGPGEGVAKLRVFPSLYIMHVYTDRWKVPNRWPRYGLLESARCRLRNERFLDAIVFIVIPIDRLKKTTANCARTNVRPTRNIIEYGLWCMPY